ATGPTAKSVVRPRGASGPRLVFPAEFVGRGDMSRGGLLLRSARDRRELTYLPVAGAVRRGVRPARLVPRPGILGPTAERSLSIPKASAAPRARRRRW